MFFIYIYIKFQLFWFPHNSKFQCCWEFVEGDVRKNILMSSCHWWCLRAFERHFKWTSLCFRFALQQGSKPHKRFVLFFLSNSCSSDDGILCSTIEGRCKYFGSFFSLRLMAFPKMKWKVGRSFADGFWRCWIGIRITLSRLRPGANCAFHWP